MEGADCLGCLGGPQLLFLQTRKAHGQPQRLPRRPITSPPKQETPLMP